MTGVVVRSAVEPGLPYAKYQDSLRFDFWFSCAYCSITEVEATAVGFQIDHFKPQTREGTNEYSNLMWSCTPCNRKKSNIWPADHLVSQGYRFIRPDEDDPNDHLAVDPANDFRLKHLTNAGHYTRELLQLDRKPLLDLRKTRQVLYETKEAIAFGLGRLGEKRRGLDQLKPQYRAQFLKAIEDAKAAERSLAAALNELSFDDVVRSLSKSTNFESAEDRRANSARCRAYLDALNAQVPKPAPEESP